MRVGRNVRAKQHVTQWMYAKNPNEVPFCGICVTAAMLIHISLAQTREIGTHYTCTSRASPYRRPAVLYASEGNRFIKNDDL